MSGFVVKASDGRAVKPLWLLAECQDGHWFGSRDKATVFPTREAANIEATKWDALLRPALSVVVEPA